MAFAVHRKQQTGNTGRNWRPQQAGRQRRRCQLNLAQRSGPNTWRAKYLAGQILGGPNTWRAKYLAGQVLGGPSAWRVKCLAGQVLGWANKKKAADACGRKA
jgi:hypothetical protein